MPKNAASFSDPHSPRGRIELTRRQLLGTLGVTLTGVAIAPLLAACSDDGGSAGDAGTSSGATTGAPSGAIDFLSWEGYDLPEQMGAWEKSNDVELRATYIASYDEIQSKLAAGAEGYDLITYNQAFKAQYEELQIITPIDPDRVPNLENLFPFFGSDEGNFWVDANGSRMGVPWTWGSEGITYDTSAIPKPESWYDLLDPKLTGRIAVVDSQQDNLFNAARILGVDPSMMSEQDLIDVADLMRQFVAQAKGISPSYGDMVTKLVSGEAVACFAGWAAMNQFAADAGKKTITTILPKEGSESFCDAWAIPPTVDNVDAVYAWINKTLEPSVHAKAAEGLVAGVTIADAVPLLDASTASLYQYEDLEQLLSQAPFFENPPTQSDQYVTLSQWLQTWEQIKAGG
ncbi:MAG: extracellular solute-binding protein [Actinomycetota bacterium]